MQKLERKNKSHFYQQVLTMLYTYRLQLGCYLCTHISKLSCIDQKIRFLHVLNLQGLQACLLKMFLRNNLTKSPIQRPVNEIYKTFALSPSISKSCYAIDFYVALNSSFLHCNTLLYLTPLPSSAALETASSFLVELFLSLVCHRSPLVRQQNSQKAAEETHSQGQGEALG